FVKNVVREATGYEMGFGYRSGYLDAGAFEVSPSEAQAGDIIQIADDSNSDPGASYPGLHTVIIMANNGDGTFDAIDSNQRWDGVVRLRPNYDPAAAAARYPGLNYRIYRFPIEGSVAPVRAVAPPPPAPDEV